MKIGFIEQENRRHELERTNRPETNNTADLSAGAISRETFIWLPFAGAMSAFAVILPKPRE
jgi:hypothetical protein